MVPCSNERMAVMSLLSHDPWFDVYVLFAWHGMANLGILVSALLLRGLAYALGFRRKLRFRTLAASILLFLVYITIHYLVNSRGVVVWQGLLHTYLPALTAPLMAMLGSWVWPRVRNGQQDS